MATADYGGLNEHCAVVNEPETGLLPSKFQGFRNSRERFHRKAGKLMWEMGGGLQQMGVAVW